jgi:hypothetical protein
MRSFAIIAGLAVSANAYAYGYPASNETTSAYNAYPAASSPAAYTTTTAVVTGLTTVCSEATSFAVGTKTYVVTKPTTIIDEECEYTTTAVVKPTPAAVKPSSYAPVVPSVSAPAAGKPSMPAPVVPYPSKNGTAPTYAAPTGTAAPSSTKPSSPQFTGAAAQAGVGMLAIFGAVAAFL